MPYVSTLQAWSTCSRGHWVIGTLSFYSVQTRYNPVSQRLRTTFQSNLGIAGTECLWSHDFVREGEYAGCPPSLWRAHKRQGHWFWYLGVILTETQTDTPPRCWQFYPLRSFRTLCCFWLSHQFYISNVWHSYDGPNFLAPPVFFPDADGLSHQLLPSRCSHDWWSYGWVVTWERPLKSGNVDVDATGWTSQ